MPAGQTGLVSDSTPRVESITPSAAIPGGEIAIRGEGFAASNNTRPRVMFGDTEAGLLIAAKNYLVARVPEGAAVASVRVATSHGTSPAVEMQLGVQIAENLNPVANPAVDGEGNIYVTYSGQRGQKVPVSLYKITANYQVKPFATELVNPTGLALDAEKNLFVGDRSGTIFKISPDRQIFVFATLEPSIAAYHLAFSPAGELYVAGPTTSSYDRIVRINRQGEVNLFYRGLGRPQGLAFDREGNLYVAASLNGRRGIARITPDGEAEVVLSGMGLVGLALLPTRRAVLGTNSALFSVDWNIEGLALPV